jgi:hypothetical protein
MDSRAGFKRNQTKAHYFTGTYVTDSNTARTLANHDLIDEVGYAPTMQYIPQSDRKGFERLLNKMVFDISNVDLAALEFFWCVLVMHFNVVYNRYPNHMII